MIQYGRYFWGVDANLRPVRGPAPSALRRRAQAAHCPPPWVIFIRMVFHPALSWTFTLSEAGFTGRMALFARTCCPLIQTLAPSSLPSSSSDYVSLSAWTKLRR